MNRTYDEGGDSRDRLIRVEAHLQHMDNSFNQALREVKVAISDLTNGSKVELAKTQERLGKLESRVDRIYWLWSAAVFVGTPLMMVLSKVVFAKLGL